MYVWNLTGGKHVAAKGIIWNRRASRRMECLRNATFPAPNHPLSINLCSKEVDWYG